MVLAQANKEQNQHYPPGIFTVHYKLASDWLKDELVKLYPTSKLIVDILKPYMKAEIKMFKNGRVSMPAMCRNLLGIGFYVKDLKTCRPVDLPVSRFADPAKPTIDELETVTAEMHVESKGITMYTIGEWNYISAHPYKKPKTFDNASGCVFGTDDVRVLPLNIPYVEVRYVVKLDYEFSYGYIMLPDETYQFDPDTTKEELWSETAIP
jgi:hypothetical protein